MNDQPHLILMNCLGWEQNGFVTATEYVVLVRIDSEYDS